MGTRLKACIGGKVPDPLNPVVHITLVPYDPAWAMQFQVEETAIRSALGAAALVVEHVGSTSISAMPAKPIIDVLLVVQDSAAEETYVSALAERGYRLHLREPHWE
jgi:GrpB-like predicted nucleotidyltransferase (UPF0157 family)